jgi:hypothetical protein
MNGTDTGASSTDTSTTDVDTSVEADGGGDAGAEGGEGGETKAEVKKRQVRWLGRDLELTEDEMAARFDDDYEWEFHGAGGKPLMQDGKPYKLKWPEIHRQVMMGKGAADSARRHNEALKQMEERKAWAKQPENRMAFLREDLGIDDIETWVLQQANEAYKTRARLIELSKSDPVAYEREVRAEIEAKEKRTKEANVRLEQQRQQAAQREQARNGFFERVGTELKTHRVPMNARTKELAEQIVSDYAAAGAELSFGELATLVRDQYNQEWFSYIDGRPDEDVLKLFGDKRRERLRKAEIAAMKDQKKAVAAAKPKPTNTNGTARREDRVITEADIMGRRRA